MPSQDEPQTLDQVVDAAAETTEPTAETPQESTPEVAQEAQEESYTRIDPKTLTPELQAMHKSLLRDYTKKTQALAKQRKEYEEYLSKQQQQTTQPQEPAAQQFDPQTMSVEEYTNFMLSQMDQRLTEKQEQQFLETAVAEFEAADERLNDKSPAYDKYMRSVVGEKLDEALDAYKKETGTVIGFDYQGMTADLVKQYENYMDSKAKEIAALKAQQAFSGVKRNAPHGATGSQAPSKPAGGMSLDDALDDAFSKQ